ncbi:transposase [Qipengyuania sp. GH38]|uniref:transposase n=1 Tax=Qipengyuania intermedia TaxID=2867244 RepID=UPI001C88821F|nr:transposase [Qipengyuania intermedia]MBX7513179.1 transposase [Qipengyuania intermedia]
MPRIIHTVDDVSHDLHECIEMLSTGFDPEDEDSLKNASLAMRRLVNDRSFLADLLIEQLKENHRGGGQESGYGPQAIVLSPNMGSFFLRANIWPSEDEACVRASGAKAFVYGVPHDHNFSFLTAGYFGPGYLSDYHEYDYEDVAGFRGEQAGLRFVERSALSEGRMMLYRAHRDVHAQLPPDRLSVSLNIMHVDPAKGWWDQYGFDLDSNAVTGILNPTSTECFLRCAIGIGTEEALDFAEWVGTSHPSDRLRLASYEAWCGLLDKAGQDALWRRAEQSGNRLIAAEAALQRAAL